MPVIFLLTLNVTKDIINQSIQQLFQVSQFCRNRPSFQNKDGEKQAQPDKETSLFVPVNKNLNKMGYPYITRKFPCSFSLKTNWLNQSMESCLLPNNWHFGILTMS